MQEHKIKGQVIQIDYLKSRPNATSILNRTRYNMAPRLGTHSLTSRKINTIQGLSVPKLWNSSIQNMFIIDIHQRNNH